MSVRGVVGISSSQLQQQQQQQQHLQRPVVIKLLTPSLASCLYSYFHNIQYTGGLPGCGKCFAYFFLNTGLGY